MTHTYATLNIVLVPLPDSLIVFAEDFSVDTNLNEPLPEPIARFLDVKHVRKFPSMAEFTVWLHEVSAIVEDCYCLVGLPEGVKPPVPQGDAGEGCPPCRYPDICSPGRCRLEDE